MPAVVLNFLSQMVSQHSATRAATRAVRQVDGADTLKLTANAKHASTIHHQDSHRIDQLPLTIRCHSLQDNKTRSKQDLFLKIRKSHFHRQTFSHQLIKVSNQGHPISIQSTISIPKPHQKPFPLHKEDHCSSQDLLRPKQHPNLS